MGKERTILYFNNVLTSVWEEFGVYILERIFMYHPLWTFLQQMKINITSQLISFTVVVRCFITHYSCSFLS